MDIHIISKQIRDDTGRTRIFSYFLTVEAVCSGTFCWENYGVRITEEGVDSVCIPGLTTSATRIDELLTILTDNVVGPVGLRDVVDDWM